MWDDAVTAPSSPPSALVSSNREAPPDVDHSLWPGLWEGAASRVPHFNGVRQDGSWAGFYEYSPFTFAIFCIRLQTPFIFSFCARRGACHTEHL